MHACKHACMHTDKTKFESKFNRYQIWERIRIIWVILSNTQTFSYKNKRNLFPFKIVNLHCLYATFCIWHRSFFICNRSKSTKLADGSSNLLIAICTSARARVCVYVCVRMCEWEYSCTCMTILPLTKNSRSNSTNK